MKQIFNKNILFISFCVLGIFGGYHLFNTCFYNVNNTKSPVNQINKPENIDSIQQIKEPNDKILRSWVNDSTICWPDVPKPLEGSILPFQRIVAFYGNPLSKRMGILGELPPDSMFMKLDEEVKQWESIDPEHPVKKAFHLISVVAQGAAGRDKKYRLRMEKSVIEKVLAWANQKDALLFLDIQVGHSNLQSEIPFLDTFLRMPNVHLGIDAEFAMHGNAVPGRVMGSLDAADINYASEYLSKLVKDYQLPPKLLIVHRFKQKMITNYRKIRKDANVQLVMHMDGWGDPSLKRSSYYHFIMKEPVEYTGFKLFYKNDIKCKEPMMTPEDIMKLNPLPLYIQYQ